MNGKFRRDAVDASRPALLLRHYLRHDFCRRFYEEFMLVGMYPLLEVLQRLALFALDLPGHDGSAPVDLRDNVVDHDACPVVLERAGLEVSVCALDGAGAVVFTCLERRETPSSC